MRQQQTAPGSSSLVFHELKIAARWACNALYEHCAVDARPGREVLDRNLVLSCIDDAAALGMESVEFTGGEPLLCPEDVLAFTSQAHACGLAVRLDTNAFWAWTPDLARRRLAELRQRGLSSVTLSTDCLHQVFIPLARVVNALEACDELGIPVAVTVCYLENDPSLPETVAVLHRHTAHIHLQAVAPYGRAAGLVHERLARCPLSRAATPCRGAAPTIAPDGRVTLCCAPPMYLPVDIARISPLVLGWLDREPLSQIVRRAQEDPFVQLLVNQGLGAVLARLEKLRPGLFQPRAEGYFGACDLCVQVLGSEEILSQLVQLLPSQARSRAQPGNSSSRAKRVLGGSRSASK
ncbi:MAG TPA: hypothetical protein VEW48_23290 [Thermoanaerobaculia bacterium]|nr:hypothetical protein [Thermoanaerobaculia bacterium]